MNNLEAYKIWALDDALWTQWAKPTMFSQEPTIWNGIRQFEIPEVSWFSFEHDAMIIVDLEGDESVRVGIALAELGFRPVPLFNGNRGSGEEIINVDDLEMSLYWGAEKLARINLEKNAKPAFLLDARRMKDGKRVNTFDNRWCVFPQDMPSAEYLIHNNIKKVIVNSNTIREDLSHILFRYQEKGIIICQTNDNGIKQVKVHKPSRFKSIGYRLKVIMGLTRNPAGGFGSQVPDPMTRNSGFGVRGYG